MYRYTTYKYLMFLSFKLVFNRDSAQNCVPQTISTSAIGPCFTKNHDFYRSNIYSHILLWEKLSL